MRLLTHLISYLRSLFPREEPEACMSVGESFGDSDEAMRLADVMRGEG